MKQTYRRYKGAALSGLPFCLLSIDGAAGIHAEVWYDVEGFRKWGQGLLWVGFWDSKAVVEEKASNNKWGSRSTRSYVE
jgi:hypothetical protein